jgi:type II secretory pathway pseudopilin PulG
MSPQQSARTDLEAGISLIELIIAATMAVVITGAAVALLISSLKRQPDLTQRADQVANAQVATERMVSDIRQGVIGTAIVTKTATPAPGTSELALETYVDGQCGTNTVTTGTKCTVTYTCAAEVCKRKTGTGTATNTRTVISGVKNTGNVFEVIKGVNNCTTPTSESPRFVGVAVELRSQKGGVTKLEDGATMQSCS